MFHGLKITETAAGARSIAAASLAVIGIVATSSALGDEVPADIEAAFPLNRPVLVAGTLAAAIGEAGSGGTLKPALQAIADQASPIVVVVRVEEGVDDAETAANVIGDGDGAEFTGMQALLAAEAQLGVRPRILGAPGLDNPAVTAAMVVVAKKLRAMVYAAVLADTVAEATTYRDTFSDRELMLIWPDTAKAETFPGDIVARALGLRAQIDEEQGWHKTISNVGLSGVVGLSRDVHFDLLDPSTEAAVLNDNRIVTVVRQNGFRLWGNRTAAGDDIPEFSFESAVRTSHALQDEIASVVAPFFDKPMTVGLIKDLLETGNARFRQLAGEGRIIGAEMFFDEELNSAQELAAGRPKFRFQFTPAAPLENPEITFAITDFYYSGFADLLV